MLTALTVPVVSSAWSADTEDEAEEAEADQTLAAVGATQLTSELICSHCDRADCSCMEEEDAAPTANSIERNLRAQRSYCRRCGNSATCTCSIFGDDDVTGFAVAIASAQSSLAARIVHPEGERAPKRARLQRILLDDDDDDDVWQGTGMHPNASGHGHPNATGRGSGIDAAAAAASYQRRRRPAAAAAAAAAGRVNCPDCLLYDCECAWWRTSRRSRERGAPERHGFAPARSHGVSR